MSFFQAKSYFQHRIKSKTAHGIHSPMVYEMLSEVFDSKKHYYSFGDIESLRDDLLKSKKVIEVTDLGAGSKRMKHNTRQVSAIAKHSLKRAKYAQILFRLVQWKKPKKILELGTSFGLTTCYMAKAAPDGHVVSLEGCPNISALARENIERLKIHNVEVISGSFSENLKVQLDKMKTVDLGFIDGDHTYASTLANYELIQKYCTNDSILILDDIHWSAEMNQAWMQIISKPEVTVSIDLFEMGIVFFRNGIEKQDFKIKV